MSSGDRCRFWCLYRLSRISYVRAILRIDSPSSSMQVFWVFLLVVFFIVDRSIDARINSKHYKLVSHRLFRYFTFLFVDDTTTNDGRILSACWATTDSLSAGLLLCSVYCPCVTAWSGLVFSSAHRIALFLSPSVRWAGLVYRRGRFWLAISMRSCPSPIGLSCFSLFHFCSKFKPDFSCLHNPPRLVLKSVLSISTEISKF